MLHTAKIMIIKEMRREIKQQLERNEENKEKKKLLLSLNFSQCANIQRKKKVPKAKQTMKKFIRQKLAIRQTQELHMYSIKHINGTVIALFTKFKQHERNKRNTDDQSSLAHSFVGRVLPIVNMHMCVFMPLHTELEYRLPCLRSHWSHTQNKYNIKTENKLP